jgi:hypothetical protein
MTGTCAVALLLWAVSILVTSGNLEPVYGWRGWIAVIWQFTKIALLFYSGTKLITGEQEKGKLEYWNDRLQKIIAELQETLSR